VCSLAPMVCKEFRLHCLEILAHSQAACKLPR